MFVWRYSRRCLRRATVRPVTSDQIKGLLQDSHAVAAFTSPEFEDRLMPVQELLTDIITWVGQDTGLKRCRFDHGLRRLPDTIPNVQHDLNDAFNIVILWYNGCSQGDCSNASRTFALGLFQCDRDGFQIFKYCPHDHTTIFEWNMAHDAPILFAGGTLHIMQSFDAAKFLKIVEQEKITHTFMVPAQFLMVLNSQRSLSEPHQSGNSFVSGVTSASRYKTRDHREDFVGLIRALWVLRGFCNNAETRSACDKI